MPVPYQYSVLRQFDNDPDDDVVDPEHSLNMMVEDTSSDEEEIIDNANLSSTSSKTIGAIDTNPPDANAVIYKKTFTISSFHHKFPLAWFCLFFNYFQKPFQLVGARPEKGIKIWPFYRIKKTKSSFLNARNSFRNEISSTHPFYPILI